MEAETHTGRTPGPCPSLLPGPAYRGPPAPQRQARGPWWGWALTWVCGAVARWAGELFSRALSRASSLETACCRSCTTVGVQGCWLDGRAQGRTPPHQAQGGTPHPHQPRASPPRRLWFSTSRLAIRVTSSLWSPLGPLEVPGPALCKAGEKAGLTPLPAPRGPPFTAVLKQSPKLSLRGEPCEHQAEAAPQPSGNPAQEARCSGGPDTEAAQS